MAVGMLTDDLEDEKKISDNRKNQLLMGGY